MNVKATRTIEGTNPVTGRLKRAKGTGIVLRTENKGFHGLVTVIRWANGVESYHCADLFTGEYATI